MIDLVYLLGNGSKWDNNELRYSLRSVEQHFTNVGKVWIVGELPEWIRNVKHLPYREMPNQAALNIAFKIVHASRNEDITPDFLLMSDDYFLLQDFDASQFPKYYHGTLEDSIAALPKSNYYRQVLKNTLEYLNTLSLPSMNFNLHMPMEINRRIAALRLPVWRSVPTVSKSIYGNYRAYLDDKWFCEFKEIADVKLRKPMPYDDIVNTIAVWPCFSVDAGR